MEIIVALIVQLIAGGVGGNIIGQAVKQFSLGTTGNSIAGAIGGVAGTWLTALIPGLAGIVGAGATGMDAGALAGQGVAGLIGGGLLTVIAGAIKSSMAKA